MAFEVTTAIKKMLAMSGRKKIIQGGTNSGKTYGIIPIVYDKCLANPRFKATVVAESLPAVKDGCIDIFKNFMMDEGRWNDNQWNASDLVYTASNKAKIQFKSFDTVGKAKAAGKRDLLFLNEGNHIPFLIADALIIRSQEVWIDFNADSEFWAHTEILPQPNTEFLKLTYLDNEALPPATFEDLMYKKKRAEIEERNGMKSYWWNWWQVYGLGNIGNLQGVVFDNWTHADELPKESRFLGYGMDFGFTNDPTTLTGVWLLGEDLYLKELIYQTDLTGSDITNKMHALGIDKRDEIFADCADPRTIEEIRRRGFNIKESIKGPDSVNAGIDTLKRYSLKVLPGSDNLAKELRAYKWLTDRNGKAVNKPEDFMNHSIDGVRYVAASKLRKPERTGKRYTMV